MSDKLKPMSSGYNGRCRPRRNAPNVMPPFSKRKLRSKAPSNAPAIPEISYNPEDLLKDFFVEERCAFEQIYPKSLYDDIARHRAIVSGAFKANKLLAIRTLMQHVFFLGENGKRMIYGPDIQAYTDKSKNISTWFEVWYDEKNRKHFLLKGDRSLVDRPILYSYLDRHHSEKQWNVPRENPYHFLNFPPEIRVQIMGYLLLVEDVVAPKTITATRRTDLELPGYSMRKYSQSLVKSTVRIPRTDRNGPYEEIRYVYQKPIDATCLRVCKQFWMEGSAILYGYNTFEFTEIPYSIRDFGNIYTLGSRGYFILRHSHKPGLGKIESEQFTRDVLKFMDGRQTSDHLRGWIYCDPFLRFLHTIGPRNAASLRSICLQGKLMRHGNEGPLLCEPECRDECLKYYLRLYGPFLRMYCPGISKVTIRLQQWTRDMKSPHRIENALVKILRSERANLPSLRELVVRDIEGNLFAADWELLEKILA